MNIRLINDSDWEKNFNLDKSIIRIGSQVSCDIQIRDPNVQPLMMQITRSGGKDVQYSIRFFAKNILISRGEQVTPAEQMRPYNLLDGDSISFGIYRLTISLGDDKTRVRTSRHMSAEMFISSRELSPESPINGIVELKNLGTEKSCQFRMSIKGIPEACLQSSPLPYLYPGASSSVGFIISHLHTKPAPGFQRIIITISAPEEYFGEMIEFNQDVYVYPVFDNDFILEDDSEGLSGFNSAQRDEMKAEEVIKPAIMSIQDGNLMSDDSAADSAERPDSASSIRVVGSGDNSSDPFATPEEDEADKNTPYVRRKKQEPVVVIRHDDKDGFETGKAVNESVMVPEETVKPTKISSGRVKKSEVISEIAVGQAEEKAEEVFSEDEAVEEPVKKTKKADVPRLEDVPVISAENKADFDENDQEGAAAEDQAAENQEPAVTASAEQKTEKSQDGFDEESAADEQPERVEQPAESEVKDVLTTEDTTSADAGQTGEDEAAASKIGGLTLGTNTDEIPSENEDESADNDDAEGTDSAEPVEVKPEAEVKERVVEIDPAFDADEDQASSADEKDDLIDQKAESAEPVVVISQTKTEQNAAFDDEPSDQSLETEPAENKTEPESESAEPVDMISEEKAEESQTEEKTALEEPVDQPPEAEPDIEKLLSPISYPLSPNSDIEKPLSPIPDSLSPKSESEESQPKKGTRKRKSSGRKKSSSQLPPTDSAPEPDDESPLSPIPYPLSPEQDVETPLSPVSDPLPLKSDKKSSRSPIPYPVYSKSKAEEKALFDEPVDPLTEAAPDNGHSLSTISYHLSPKMEEEIIRETHPNYVIRKGGGFDEPADISSEEEPASEPKEKPEIRVMKGGAFDE